MVTRSRSAGEARPVRIELNSWCVASIDLSIRLFASARKSSIAAIRAPSLGGTDDRADALARGDAPDVALRQLEHVDREPVVHAQREGGRVHHLEPALDRLEVRELGDELRGRILVRVPVVDALYLVLCHQDRL